MNFVFVVVVVVVICLCAQLGENLLTKKYLRINAKGPLIHSRHHHVSQPLTVRIQLISGILWQTGGSAVCFLGFGDEVPEGVIEDFSFEGAFVDILFFFCCSFFFLLLVLVIDN